MGRNVSPSPVEVGRRPGTAGIVSGVDRAYLTQDASGHWGISTSSSDQDGSFRTSSGRVVIGAVSADERLARVQSRLVLSTAPAV